MRPRGSAMLSQASPTGKVWRPSLPHDAAPQKTLHTCRGPASIRRLRRRPRTASSPPPSAPRHGPTSPSCARTRTRPWRSRRRRPGARRSTSWRVRFGLMLGLERVLSERPPRLASGTELRRHQIDALAGMLTELIAANQRGFAPLNGNGTVPAEELVEAPEEDENGEPVADAEAELEPLDSAAPADPGAVRRFRFRHPTASGKTIAAAGFVEAARTLGVLILTHRRLLVS